MLDWLQASLQRRPAALRTLLRFGKDPLQRFALTFADGPAVVDIFERSRDFQVGSTIAPKAKLGPFLLSLDEGPRHTREKRALSRAIGLSFATFAPIAAAESARAAADLALQLGDEPRIDLASDFAELVYTRTLARYFGLPLDGWQCPDLDAPDGERTLALYIRTLGSTIGSGHPAPFGLEQLALRVSKKFEGELEAVISQQMGQQPADTVLGHLLQPQPRPGEDAEQVRADAEFVQQDGLVRSIGGLLSAGAGFPKAFSNAIHEWILHGQLHVLEAASRQLPDPAWGQLVQAHVLEALRLRPVFPLLVRYCPRATALAGQEVPAGSEIAFAPIAAMSDPTLVESPEEYRPGRPDHVYSVFGWGPRACIGRNMMLGLVPPMLKALFAQVPGFANAPLGEFAYDGPALDRYWFTPQPHAAHAQVS
ncbi:MAG TPA: cytochrome P450 [Polyangiales bacterium]|nr:cytochrome P450 [Polyangiales bacterium]